MTINLLNTRFAIQFAGGMSVSFGEDSTTYAPSANITKTLTDGSGADMASKVVKLDLICTDAKTDHDNAAALIDLSAVQTPFGGPIDFGGGSIKTILIYNESLTKTIAFGNLVDAGFPFLAGLTDNVADAKIKVTILPGQVFMMTATTAAGWAITNGANDQIQILNITDATEVAYTLILAGVGTSA